MPELPNIPINIDWFGLVGKFASTMLYVVVGAVGAIAAYMFFVYMQHNISMTYWELHGSGKDGAFAIGKKKTTRLRWIKNKTAWNSFWPLFNKNDIRPFDAEFIYPGKQVYAYKLNDEFSPARHNVKAIRDVLSTTKLYAKVAKPGTNHGYDYVQVNDITPYIPVKIGENLDEEFIRGRLDAVPYDMKNWYNSKLKENEMEFQSEDWWASHKHMITTIGVTLICAVMVIAGAYLAYKMVLSGNAHVTEQTNRAVNAFSQFTQGLASKTGGGPAG